MIDSASQITWLWYPAGFAAGFVSFVSPCVLPLIPGYLSYISGVATNDLDGRPRAVGVPTAGFVAGFTVVFIVLGVAAGGLGALLVDYRDDITLVGGALMILFGLALIGSAVAMRVAGAALTIGALAWGALRIAGDDGVVRPVGALALGVVLLAFGPRVLAALKSERRVPLSRGGTGVAGAVLVGMTFALGWTPCLGPILGAFLTKAGEGGSVVGGGSLLLVYSLGLGVPFILAGLFFSRAVGTIAAIRRHLAPINAASGALIVGFGVLLATGRLTEITQSLSRYGFGSL